MCYTHSQKRNDNQPLGGKIGMNHNRIQKIKKNKSEILYYERIVLSLVGVRLMFS